MVYKRIKYVILFASLLLFFNRYVFSGILLTRHSDFAKSFYISSSLYFLAAVIGLGSLIAFFIFKKKKNLSTYLLHGIGKEESVKICKRLYSIIDEGVYVFPIASDGLPGEFIDVNEGAMLQLGYTKEEFLALSLFSISKKIDKEWFIKNNRSSKDGYKTVYEDTYVTKSGREIPVKIIHSCFENKGRPVVMLAVKDLSDKKASEEQVLRALGELKKANKSLNSLNKMKSNFLKIISHELRTPLNAVLGFSDVLKDDKGLSDEQRERILIIYEKSKMLSSIIDKIIEASEYDTKLDYMPVSRNEILTYVLATGESLSIQKGVGFEVNIADVDVFIIDFSKVKKIIKIMIENAFFFTEKGKVSFSMFEKNEGYEITITDTGSGIDEDAFDNLLKLFDNKQDELPDYNSHKGVGLSLIICRKLLDCLNGRIEFETSIGEGTKVFIYIPKKLEPL